MPGTQWRERAEAEGERVRGKRGHGRSGGRELRPREKESEGGEDADAVAGES